MKFIINSKTRKHCAIQFHLYKLSKCLDDSMLVALFHCREGRAFHWIMVIFPHPLSQIWWPEKFRKLPVFSVLGGVQVPTTGVNGEDCLVDKRTVIFHFDACVSWITRKSREIVKNSSQFFVDETKELIERGYRKNSLI